eukprot:34760-Eustigmatos_ZCMA.PRE.1
MGRSPLLDTWDSKRSEPISQTIMHGLHTHCISHHLNPHNGEPHRHSRQPVSVWCTDIPGLSESPCQVVA